MENAKTRFNHSKPLSLVLIMWFSSLFMCWFLAGPEMLWSALFFTFFLSLGFGALATVWLGIALIKSTPLRAPLLWVLLCASLALASPFLMDWVNQYFSLSGHL